MEKILNYFNRQEISNSDLNLFDKSPLKFKLKKERKLESITSKSLELGTLIHLAILEPANFVVENITKPTAAMLKYMETLYSTKDKDLAYTQSGYKISQKRVEAKMKDPENLEYYEFLQKATGKVVLSDKENELITGIEKSTRSNRKAYKLLYDEDIWNDNSLSYNEVEIFFEMEGIKCKSKIDRLIVDKESNTAMLVDLKTTSRPIYGECKKIDNSGILLRDWHVTGFPASILNYNYHRQLVFYGHAIRAFLKQKEYEDVDNITILPYIVAVETNYPYECVVYTIPKEWLVDAEFSVINSLSNYMICKEEGIWIPNKVKDGLITLNDEDRFKE